jgi:hypothetical protein
MFSWKWLIRWWSFGVLRRVVVRCSDVSKECTGTASIFRATELVLVDAEVTRRKVSDGFVMIYNRYKPY